MKKIICVFLLVLAVLVVGGCDHTENIVLNNMSDIRINFFEGQNDIIWANLSCGQREQDFDYDGKSTELVECGVLTVGYFETHSYSSISVILNVDGTETEYVLEKSPYEDVFMEDIGKILTNKNQISLKLKNSDNEIVLTEVSQDWKVNYKNAVKIGTDYLKQDLSKLYFNGTLHAEGYLKVVSKINHNKKYWYFSIIDQSGKNYSLLIDVNSGDIISNYQNKKVTK